MDFLHKASFTCWRFHKYNIMLVSKFLKGNFKAIPGSIWALGYVSLFTDMSSELIHSLLPYFMVTVLGASMTYVGLIEGVAESSALIVKIFSGPISDVLQRRKLVTVIGYGISTLSKLLFPLAHSISTVFFGRLFDRIGKGVRDAPRNALLGELAPAKIRGACFGLRESLDTVGAMIGPLLAILLMFLLSNNIYLVLWIAIIPAFISLGILIFGVKEPPKKRVKSKYIFMHELKIRSLNSAYWKLVVIGFLLALARFSQAFLLLKVQASGLVIMFIPIAMVITSIFYAISGYPAGKLSDYVGRKFVLLFGIGFLIVADLILGFSNSLWIVFLGISFWGLHLGFTESLLATIITDITRAELRGTAFGIFNFISGLGMLGASLVAGILWDHYGAKFSFLAGAIFAITALIMTLCCYGRNQPGCWQNKCK